MTWPRQQALPYFDDSAAYLQGVMDMPWPVWLDSGGGRFDYIAAAPVEQISVNACAADELLQKLRHGLGEVAELPGQFPFAGGWVGYLGYELGRFWNGLEGSPEARLSDDARLGLYDWVIVVDHERQTASLVSLGRHARTHADWDALCERLTALAPVAPVVLATQGCVLNAGMPLDRYTQRFDQLQQYIREGDTYQVNLTRRWMAQSPMSALELYRALRTISPAPYGAYLAFADYQVLSNSPEQFVSAQDGWVSTRPIKGTRPRGATPQQDARLRAELASSEKDRAENLMIVDLLRNDIGKVCRPGSIEAPSLFSVESFAKVHHLVSTVTGELADGLDALDLLLACFPGGSITGAPKRRAMEIIDELEPVSRELYCGSVIRLGYDGNLDSSISIRTLLRRDETLYYWAGGGVVADSDARAEYRESADKAAAFLTLLGG